MSSKLFDQADALMRRRSFVAGTKAERAEPEWRAEVADDCASDDVPVLTDVVNDDLVAQGSQTPGGETDSTESEANIALRIELALRQRLSQLLMDRQALLAQEIEAWLDEQMPQLVIRAMDGITDHLVALLANRAKDELLPRLEAALKPPDATETDADRAA
ncbi:MAG: hypothetical protein NT159_05995 [Proteobacteria bacterium]|nr:hypothetical protein [Pseudomonadota bacterium]